MLKMDPVSKYFIVLSLLTTNVLAEVCYEYKNSNTRAFECADGCCGSNTDAYCCMSPILIVGIVVGCLAGLIIIGVICFICYQKYKQRQFNNIQNISIDQLSDNPTPRKANKESKKHAKGGMITTTHGDNYNKPTMQTNGIGGYNDYYNYNYNNKSTLENPDLAYPPLPPPPPPVPRTGTWLLNNNNSNTGTRDVNQLPPPPPPAPSWNQPKPVVKANVMGPIGENTVSTAEVFNIPVGDMPAHPGAADLYSDSAIRPLPSTLPPLPPLQPRNPLLTILIAIGSLAGSIIISLIIFICFKKCKQRKFNKKHKIPIDRRKAKKGSNQRVKGGMVTTTHGEDYNNPTMQTGTDGENLSPPGLPNPAVQTNIMGPV